jgi:leucyl-tRNA synthetase
MMRITSYAQRLLDDLDTIDWPNSTKEMQRNWIGRSEGAEIQFPLAQSGKEQITVFTTRPDTIFGATYMVLAPEHPMVDVLTSDTQKKAIEEYRQQTVHKSDLERTALEKEKTGVFTGGYAVNPATNEKIPVWIADYVLWGYGTGAIMAVPAHDERDFEFAQKYKLPIRCVVLPPIAWCEQMVKNANITDDAEEMTLYEKHALEHHKISDKNDLTFAHIAQSFYILHPEDFKEAYTEEGTGINSANNQVSLDGLSTSQAKGKIIAWVEAKNTGRGKVQFKLRDWLFSRQRYWGEPIPILHLADGTMKPLDEKELPLILPDLKEFKPSGTTESPLALVPDWVNVTDPETGLPARRETNTMPQWAASCWYYLRYLDPHNDTLFCDPQKEKYWMPVDLYIGGAEHAVLHLLYARFWHKVLFDLGYASTDEPFQKLIHQGMILGEDNQKMSKSRGNVINPDDVVRDWGADAFRLFEMFMGPLEMMKPWSTKGVEGVFRFLNRAWNMIIDEQGNVHRSIADAPMTREQERVLHYTIKKIGEDIDGLRFNTAISQMMIFVNEFFSAAQKSREAMEKFVLLLSPFAPHIAEELWTKLGHTSSLAYEPFPAHDPAKAQADTVEVVIQVNGKLRGKMHVPLNTEEETLLANAMKDEAVRKFIGDQKIVKTITVKNKLVNIVAK